MNISEKKQIEDLKEELLHLEDDLNVTVEKMVKVYVKEMQKEFVEQMRKRGLEIKESNKITQAIYKKFVIEFRVFTGKEKNVNSERLIMIETDTDIYNIGIYYEFTIKQKKQGTEEISSLRNTIEFYKELKKNDKSVNIYCLYSKDKRDSRNIKKMDKRIDNFKLFIEEEFK